MSAYLFATESQCQQFGFLDIVHRVLYATKPPDVEIKPRPELRRDKRLAAELADPRYLGDKRLPVWPAKNVENATERSSPILYPLVTGGGIAQLCDTL
ncbi:MAG TPA: hypothetical protein VGK19_25365 [Capsulimonadaceae bacterium]